MGGGGSEGRTRGRGSEGRIRGSEIGKGWCVGER